MIKINRRAINYKILISDEPCISVTKNGFLIQRTSSLIFQQNRQNDKDNDITCKKELIQKIIKLRVFGQF